MRRRAVCATALIAALSLTAASPVMAIEEPAYRVVRTAADFEVRAYAPYTVAEVEIDGPAGEAGGLAFPILFGYISGKNDGERRLAMTAPVVQAMTSRPMAMTAPVLQSSADRTVVQFVLPKDVTRTTAPLPLDARIHVRDVAAQRYAVIRYAGFWSDANYQEHLARLAAALATTDLHVVGEPLFARYDAPFKPWFMRRNEIWLPVTS